MGWIKHLAQNRGFWDGWRSWRTKLPCPGHGGKAPAESRLLISRVPLQANLLPPEAEAPGAVRAFGCRSLPDYLRFRIRDDRSRVDGQFSLLPLASDQWRIALLMLWPLRALPASASRYTPPPPANRVSVLLQPPFQPRHPPLRAAAPGRDRHQRRRCLQAGKPGTASS